MPVLEITGIGSALQGVGRLADGRAAFVAGALPGERAEIEIVKEAGRYVVARLICVLSPAPERAASACPYAGECGGCQGRHMTYEATLHYKRQIALDACARLGGLADPILPATRPSPQTERYRNKAEYPVADGRIIGCAQAASRRVIPVADCLLQHPASIQILKTTRAWLAKQPQKSLRYLVTRVNGAGETMAILAAEGPLSGTERLSEALFREIPGLRSLIRCDLRPRYAHALDGRCYTLRGERTLTDTLGKQTFRLSPQSFFQINAPQAAALYEQALLSARLASGERALDLYCGVGTIALAMAERAKSVLGVELVPEAVENAAHNARLNGLADKAKFVCADAAGALRGGVAYDLLCLDPPRKGLERTLVDDIRRAGPERIAYVSCNPATFARDVRLLTEGDAYRVGEIHPFDMFPWTEHVEVVAGLTRASRL